MSDTASERPKTPPPQPSSSSTQRLPLTPEQIKRIEINRLRGMCDYYACACTLSIYLSIYVGNDY
jgi:hypothetical protein